MKLLTINELAGKLSVSTRTILNWRQQRRLPKPLDIGGKPRWIEKEIDDWLVAKRLPY